MQITNNCFLLIYITEYKRIYQIVLLLHIVKFCQDEKQKQ